MEIGDKVTIISGYHEGRKGTIAKLFPGPSTEKPMAEIIFKDFIATDGSWAHIYVSRLVLIKKRELKFKKFCAWK